MSNRAYTQAVKSLAVENGFEFYPVVYSEKRRTFRRIKFIVSERLGPNKRWLYDKFIRELETLCDADLGALYAWISTGYPVHRALTVRIPLTRDNPNGEIELAPAQVERFAIIAHSQRLRSELNRARMSLANSRRDYREAAIVFSAARTALEQASKRGSVSKPVPLDPPDASNRLETGAIS